MLTNPLLALKRRWLNWSLATRFLLVYLLLSTLTVSVFTWRSGRQLTSALEEQIEHEQELEAFLIANALSAYTGESDGPEVPSSLLQAYLQHSSEELGTRVVLVDSQLRAVSSSDPVVPVGERLQTKELLCALEGEEQHDIRKDKWTGEPRLFVAAPLQGEEGIVGAVQVSIPWTKVRQKVVSEWIRLIITGALLILINILVTLWLTRSVVHPLRALTKAASDIASGHLERRLEVKSNDEVGTLARTFNHMAERLQEMITRQRMFIANASHELRSPLTSIKLRTEALIESGDNMPPERYRRFLLEIDAEADRLRRLADRLLDLSRLETQPKQPANEVVNLVPVLRDVLDIMNLRAHKGGILLRQDIPDRLPPVRGFSEELSELFLNLVDNAIKYTPRGGLVTLSACTDQDFVCISVSDTGEGIPPEDVRHVFEPFYRVDKVRSRRIGGSGLGLTIVKTIVELHGGYIEVQSEQGQGTVFTVYLPYVKAA